VGEGRVGAVSGNREWIASASVVLAVVTVIVEEPEVFTEVGLKLKVAPVGSPLALKLTVPANPFTALTVAV